MSLFDGPEYASYRDLTVRHPELVVECECRLAWLKSCGCIPGACPWCGDTGQRPKRLDELLAMLEEAGAEEVAFQRDSQDWGAGDAPSCDWDGALEWLISPIYAPTREEAAARLWMAVTGREVRA